MSAVLARLAGRHPALWGGGFAAGMLAIAGLEHGHLIARPWNLVLVALVSLSLWPLMQSAVNRARAAGSASPALIRYQHRALVWAASYVAALGLAMTVRNTLHPHGPLLWLIAVLPSLPILYFIWSMARYLIEEEDEYQRTRQIQSGLIATGILLAVATFWGFLETFAVAPHAEAWWAVPVWAIGLGAGQVIQARRGGREDGE